MLSKLRRKPNFWASGTMITPAPFQIPIASLCVSFSRGTRKDRQLGPRLTERKERVKHERELWKEVVERRQQQPLQLALGMKEYLGWKGYGGLVRIRQILYTCFGKLRLLEVFRLRWSKSCWLKEVEGLDWGLQLKEVRLLEDHFVDERRLGVEGVECCVSLGNDRRYLLKSTSSRYEKDWEGMTLN